jgi:hypothetical protein
LINTIGADRVMMGADLPHNVPVELPNTRQWILLPMPMTR